MFDINTINPDYSSDPLCKFVTISDPAIDWSKGNPARYFRTRNLQDLVFLPDKKPQVFWLRKFSPDVLNSLLQVQEFKDNTYQELRHYFQYGLAKIENAWIPGKDSSGNHTIYGDQIAKYEPGQELKLGSGRVVWCVEDRLIAQGMFQYWLIIEMGMVCKQLNFLVGMTPVPLLVLDTFQVFIEEKLKDSRNSNTPPDNKSQDNV